MVITCRFCDNRSMICPTLLATSPETPASISSKIMVGKAVFCAINDLIASISLESSPPEATLLISASAWPLLAVNRKRTTSNPLAPKPPKGELCPTDEVNSILIDAFPIPISQWPHRQKQLAVFCQTDHPEFAIIRHCC